MGQERTCVGCGARANPDQLVRLAAAAGRLALDAERRRGGRGAWLHADPACLERALRRRAFDRALRCRELAVDGEELRRLLTAIQPRV